MVSANIEQAIKEEELKKLRSEVELIELEKGEIKSRINQKWWNIRASGLIQAVIGGAVVGALVAGFGLDHFLKVIELNEKSQQAIVVEQEELIAKSRELQDETKILQAETRRLQEDQKVLIKEKEKLEDKAKILESEKEESRKEIAELKKANQLFAEKARRIRTEQKRLSTTKKPDKSVSAPVTGPEYITDVWAYGVQESIVDKVRTYLIDKGYEVGFGGLLHFKPGWLALKSTVFFYHKDSEQIARDIATDLYKNTRIKFSIQRGAGLGVVQEERKETFFIHIVQ